MFTIVISLTLCAVPVSFTDPGSGIGEEALQLSGQLPFTGIRISIGTMLSTIAGEPRFGVPEPRAFGIVFRMVLQSAAAEMTAITVVRCGLRGSGTGQATVTVRSDKKIIDTSFRSLPPDDTRASAVPLRVAWSECE